MITIGIMCSYFIGYAFSDGTSSWRYMFAIGIVPAILLGIGMLFLPESPRWLIKQGLTDKAKIILQRLRNSQYVEHEIQEIQDSMQFKQATVKDVFAPWIRPVLLLGIFLGFLQQVSGINTLIYYAPTIFQMAGFHDASSSILATVGLGIVNVLSTLFAVFYLDKLGRRPLLFAGLIGMGISLASLSLAFYFGHHFAYLHWLAFASTFVYIISFAFSLGALLWLMVAEIFPLEVRGIAMGFAVFSCWFWNFVVSATFLSLLNALGPAVTFMLYASMCFIGLAICYKIVPETRGVSLEQIEENIRAGLPLRKIGVH
jgi:SP family galactose:H+ symporter-like MFS transporter